MSEPKYAILSDIHGNLEGLTAVLDDAEKQGVTHYACLGDIVGYNANPVECLEKIQELGCVSVRGNHDHYCSLDTSMAGFQSLAGYADPSPRAGLSAFDRTSPGAGVRTRTSAASCGLSAARP